MFLYRLEFLLNNEPGRFEENGSGVDFSTLLCKPETTSATNGLSSLMIRTINNVENLFSLNKSCFET